MKLLLQRHVSTDECTTGDLYLNGQWYCYTLEDVVRKVKIKGKTAIPAGIYKVTVNWSARFQRPLPLLLDVPHYTGIRIHPLNKAEETEGCIGVGKELGKNAIYKSREAFADLFERIKVALNLNEQITIEIKKRRCRKRAFNGGRGAIMGYQGLQEGKKKAFRRVPHRYFDYTVNCGKERMEEFYQRSLVRARNTTKRCSAAIHGCGHRRDLEGPTLQERKAFLNEREMNG